MGNLIDAVLEASRQSELLRVVTQLRGDGGRALALGPAELRPLTPDEVVALESLGNAADDWGLVRVAEGFDPRRARRCQFHGRVALGRFTGTVALAEGVEVPTGVSDSTLANCVIGHEAVVRRVGLLSNYVVGEGAVVWDCGSVTCAGPTRFGNGQDLPLGPESGGRGVAVFAEISVEVAAALARGGLGRAERSRYGQILAGYLAVVESQRGVVERRAVVRHTPKVHNAYLGPHAVVDSATAVRDSTVLSSAEAPTRILSGACVSSSLLQWGSRVSDLALVERSVLAEHAAADRHATVAASVLGPNTQVSKGEVASSLVGPFVGFHHQALLISALWPAGRGNVSHGACVGANHTSRAPDQEALLGEGLFLGLAVNVKYPVDLSDSPYTVVACGVTLPPQQVRFPFALLNTPTERRPEVPPFYNEIVPGWFLAQNLYALKRTEWKHRVRNRARRASFAFEVFRPATVDLMRDACRRLAAAPRGLEVYTDREVEGLGKNYLAEPHRAEALRTYQFFIRYYALLGLFGQARAAAEPGEGDACARLLIETGDDPVWEHQRRLLAEELGVHEVAAGLRELPEILNQVARGVERSKARDDERGRKVIPDYAEMHPPATADPFVQQIWAETRRLQQQVGDLLAFLEGRDPTDDCDGPPAPARRRAASQNHEAPRAYEPSALDL